AKHTDLNGANGDPAIKVTPGRLDFGALGPNETRALPFTVQSVGTDNSILRVSGIRLEADGAYALMTADGDLSFLLPEGKEREVVATFAPEHPGRFATTAAVYSDDDGNEVVYVDLVGEGIMPELQITPDPLDYGTVNVSCARDNEVVLTNVGNAELEVTAIRESEGTFTITDLPRLPFTLDPGEAETVGIRFAPDDEDDEIGILAVDSNEAVGTREAVQKGDGHVPQRYEQTWVLAAIPKVDMLFTIDESVSMDDDQAALADNISTFIDLLSPYMPDWQIMVVKEDGGCSASGVLTPDVPDYVERFREAATEGGGGTYTEAGLTLATNAVAQSAPGACNEGFVRPDAQLHVIMVSDEPEHSEYAWDHYVNGLSAVKGDELLLKMSAIVGDVPGGCSTSDNVAAPGTGYREAALATGGLFLSICSDWGENVEALASASVRKEQFDLSDPADPFTIRVTRNGAEETGTWAYDGSANAVVFQEPYVPTDGDTIAIAYSEPTTCD
ncbi:choice-of-anchor D domain-containing protein, partial [Candidatus Uhrbacteria bacterium]|nr:choice-of-anchor D domain-containing protein [Candidatus Uhrbacteria bacterium]